MAENYLAQVPRRMSKTERGIGDVIRNYLGRLQDDFVTGGERAGRGLGQVIESGNYLEGVPRVVLGGLGAIGAPVSAAVSPVLGPLLQPVGEAVDTYVGQPIERGTGYPADITNEVFLGAATAGMAPFLKPALKGTGNFLAKAGDAVEGAANRAGYTFRPPEGTFFSGAGPVKLADDEGITAYHGSLHSFDKFSMDKIGTGEGAQAYGHGLYFAEAEDVAKSYKNAGPAANQHYDRINKRMTELAKEMDAISMPGQYRKFMDPERGAALANEYDALMEARRNVGHTYQVRLNVKPDELLDWDKPLSEQPKAIADAALSIRNEAATAEYKRRGFSQDLIEEYIDNATNRATYGDMSGRHVMNVLKEYGLSAEASAKLKASGVKGIRYLDQGSRGSGYAPQLTYNYVIFDDSLISILKKYGIPMTAGAGGAMMVSSEAMPPELAAQMGGGT